MCNGQNTELFHSTTYRHYVSTTGLASSVVDIEWCNSMYVSGTKQFPTEVQITTMEVVQNVENCIPMLLYGHQEVQKVSSHW